MNVSFSLYETELIRREMRGSFDYLWQESNAQSKVAFGLTRDTTRENKASIAATGFALAGIVVGVERGYITRQEGFERSLGTLKTLLQLDHYHGFIVHFVDMSNGKPIRFRGGEQTEYSTIDTALALAGAIVAGEYFQGEVKTLSLELVNRVQWKESLVQEGDKWYIRMAANEQGQWTHAKWDHYAEQLLMYFLIAGQENADISLARKLYFGFQRYLGAYKGKSHVYCYGNALFIHQFSHMFFDFSNYVDAKGFDWFQNSVDASLAHYRYSIDQSSWSKTMHEKSWGLTASHTRKGYGVFGAPPQFVDRFEEKNELDGTIAPYAALCSLPFTPKESMDALRFYIEELPPMWGRYGLYDAYNLDQNTPWYATDYLGIDKGPTLLMLDNVLYGTTWKYFMQSPLIQRAMERLKFQPKNDQTMFTTNVKVKK